MANLYHALSKLLICMLALALADCTTMVAHNTAEPYLHNQEKRDKLQQLAVQYCQVKQSKSGQKQAPSMPDYPFTTDGCSRWPDESWVACCIVHDITYWCGGSEKNREETDRIITHCINKKAPPLGGVMYPGVRVGGSPWLPTPWRWGYGWKKWPKGYQISDSRKSIHSILEELNIFEIVEKQLKD